jgi:glycosyltransferase involved in cell wall biosynthesis
MNSMTDMSPRISVVTPSFNQAQYLEATLQSISEQRYANIEHVVIDGGSTDGSRVLLERHSSKLAAWVSEPDAGQYAALNKGFAMTSGDVMAWLNADDVYFPSALATVAEVFRLYPQISWLSGGVAFINAEGAVTGVDRMDGGLSQNVAASGWYRRGLAGYLPQEGMFWRRSLWEASGARLEAGYGLAADYELWTRFARHASPVFLKCLVSGFRRHPRTQRSQLHAHSYEAEVEDIARRIGRPAPAWRLVRRSALSSIAFRLAFLRGRSETVEYDFERDAWVHQVAPCGALYRPLVVRRAI